jgi:hypothetical protein
LEDLKRNALWLILVETAQSLPMYRHHKAYVRESILPEEPDVSAEDLTHRLDITLGEAMVILAELRNGGAD